ncbi:HK97 family phage prohead protease [Rhodobacteraceae bacterium DSL-40]|uniref:HK97 family phage prohead protease n=1 Tax=Amaricoccus sp. B4 TaxID=3368557 RepID=UPI000DAC15E8
MDHGVHLGSLEIRDSGDGSRRLRGRFPYGKRAVISDGGRRGRPQKEEFAPKAFAYRVEKPDEEIHLLLGHSYDQPLASKLNDTLILEDTPEALKFEAIILPPVQRTTFWMNFWAGFQAGLIVGLSPGFRLPPERAVPAEEAEQIEEEDPEEGDALIRTIFQALLFEISLVTRPAYSETEVEARSLIMPPRPQFRALDRWRL